MWKALLYIVVHVLLIVTDSVFPSAHGTRRFLGKVTYGLPRHQLNETGLTPFDEIRSDYDLKPDLPIPLLNSNDSLSCPCHSCGALGYKNKIAGWIELPYAHKYPWFGMLLYMNKSYCGASLINDKYVLTAAHCVNDIEISKVEYLKVRLFEYNRKTANYHMDFNVKSVIVHDGYNEKLYDNDIALIRLQTSGIPMNPDLHSVCMPSEGVSYTQQIGIVARWGFMTQRAKVLQESELPIISNEQCNVVPTYADLITENMICAGEQENNEEVVCRGDSGSPLVINDGETHRIVGVTSFGLGCHRTPAVFTRVSKYLDWIKKNTLDACSCDKANSKNEA